MVTCGVFTGLKPSSEPQPRSLASSYRLPSLFNPLRFNRLRTLLYNGYPATLFFSIDSALFPSRRGVCTPIGPPSSHGSCSLISPSPEPEPKNAHALAVLKIFTMALLVTAARGVSGGLPPGTQDGVARCGGDIFLADGEKFPPDEPAHRGLHGTFRHSNRFRECLIADLDRCVSRFLCVCQPKIHEETDGSAVVPDEIAHEHIDNVFVHWGHRCTNHLYSNPWLIATLAGARYALPRLGGQT